MPTMKNARYTITCPLNIRASAIILQNPMVSIVAVKFGIAHIEQVTGFQFRCAIKKYAYLIDTVPTSIAGVASERAH